MGVAPATLWEMDPEQLDLLVAFTELEHEKGPHGIDMPEATDPRAAPGYYGAGAFGFKATLVPDWAQHAITVDLERRTVVRFIGPAGLPLDVPCIVKPVPHRHFLTAEPPVGQPRDEKTRFFSNCRVRLK